jgi:hypothetical protein
MAASETDVFCKVGEPGTATTMTAPGHTIGGTSISVVSTANYPTDTGVIFAIDTVSIVDGKEVRDVGSYTEWEGTVGGATTLENMVLKYGDDQNYPAGATTRVYIPVSSSRENRLVDGLLVAHAQSGILLGTADSFVGTAGEIGGAWKEWTPTVSALAPMTLSSVGVVFARYTQVGKTVYYKIRAGGTTGVSATSALNFTLPINRASGSSTQATVVGQGYINDGALVACLAYIPASEYSVVLARRYDGANLGLGSSREFNIIGFYEID